MLKALKNFDVLVISSALSYIIYMMIIPKTVTISIVVTLFVVLTAGLFARMLKTGKLKVPAYTQTFFPFVAYVVLSIFWTVNADYSFPLIRVLLTFEFGTLVCLFAKGEADIRKVAKGMIIGGGISAAVVLFNQWQFIGLMRLGEYIYGSAMEFSGGITDSAFCCLYLWKRENKKVYLILFVLFLLLCALSGSRSALAYPFIFFFLMLFFYNQNVIRIATYGMGLVLAGGFALYLCLNVPVLYDVVGHRIETLISDKTEDGSYMERKEMKEYALKIWQEKPVFGWGVNGFSKRYAEINKPVYSHCDYTEILSCYGIVGALLFYLPFARFFLRRGPFRCMKRDWTQSFLGAIFLLTIFEITHSIVFLSVRSMMLVALCIVFWGKERGKVCPSSI